MQTRSFKEEIRKGSKLIGTWLQIGSPEVVEMVGLAGFDFGVIDTEHTFFGTETAENLVRAADAVGLIPFIRVSRKEPTLIMKALDTGAKGFVYPGVTCRKDAEEAISASKYPPFGTRGACPFVRATGHVAEDWEEYAKHSNEDLVNVLLVEGREGVENFEEIIDVPCIDVVMMGPFDLSVSLGVGGQVEHPLVMEKFGQMIERAASRGIALMPNIFNPDLDKVAELSDHWFGSGCQSLIVNADKLMFSWGLKQNLETARAAAKNN